MNIDFNFVLTVIFGGIGLFSAFLAWKAWNRPKINLIAKSSTVLANLTNSSFEISVKYQEKEVSNNLILISAYLINNGNVDIDIRDVEQPVTIILPSESRWLSFQVVSNRNGMIIAETILENKLELKVGLWKKGEGFNFDALIAFAHEEVLKEKKEVFESFLITSRINGVDQINVLDLPEEKKYKNKFHKFFIHGISVVVFIMYVGLGGSLYFDGLETTRYELKAYENNEELTLKIENNQPKLLNEKVIISRDKDGFYNLKVKPVKIEKFKEKKVLGLVLILMGIFSFFMLNFSQIKEYLLRKKIRKM